MTTKIKTPGITDANVTTDKLNLISTSGTPGATIKGTSGQTDGYLQLNCEENTHGIKLKSPPHSAAQSYTLTFPQSITNGYFLKTDGSGNLSFAEVNVDDTAWQSSIVTATTLTAVAGKGYWINTTSNVCTITLPASASVGDQIIFVDYARTWGTNAVTINQNSLNFQGNSSPNPVYDVAGQSVTIVYSGATQGWIPNTDDDVTNETPQPYSVDFLVIAGGGSGGEGNGGGGGAGGYRTSTQSVSLGTAITVTVGDGGTTAPTGNSGSNSSISGSGLTTITSAGGGGGGGDGGGSGGSGGSGGGGGENGGGSGAGNTPSTSPSQGNNGGSTSVTRGGGGGGAGAVGATGSVSGNGGNGSASSITGSSVTYAGGGGGGRYSAGTTSPASAGSGGTGGGASGPNGSSTPPNATANTGGGGAGGGYTSSAGAGSSGGKGVVILSMPLANFSGTTTGSPTEATSGSNKILTFTGSGSYTT